MEQIQVALEYCKKIEQRYHDGTLCPTSHEGEEIKKTLLALCKKTADMIVFEHHKLKGGEISDASHLLSLVDLRTSMALLLGNFEGFKYGQIYVVARSGVYSQYLT